MTSEFKYSRFGYTDSRGSYGRSIIHYGRQV